MTDTPIFIPTMGRTKKQVTLSNMSDEWRWNVYLVCPPNETDELARLYGRHGVTILPCPEKGIGPTRRWFVQWAIRNGYERLLMMDDDLRFFYRREDDPTKFMTLNSATNPKRSRTETDVVFETLFGLLDLAPLVGLQNRGGANRTAAKDIPIKWNSRMHDLLGLDLEVYGQEDFDIGRMRFMEDFDLILQFLTAGYSTAMLTSFQKGDDGSGQRGGCSLYRDAAGQAQAALDLALEWPEFVQLRKVKAKTESHDGMWNERTDVRVAWAKAAEYGKSRLVG